MKGCAIDREMDEPAYTDMSERPTAIVLDVIATSSDDDGTLSPTLATGVRRSRGYTMSPVPCFICGTRWASRWTKGKRFTDDELVACFGVTGSGILCQGCRAALYHRRRTNGKKTFFHFHNARCNKAEPVERFDRVYRPKGKVNNATV